MKKYNFKESFSKGKTVYVMAAVSFCLAVIAIGVIYSRTMTTIEKSLTEISTTKQVNRNQQNVTDPRTTEKKTTPTTEATTRATTTAQTATHNITTTAEDEQHESTTTTTAVSVVAAQSYIRPHDGEIIKAYSPDVPVYCETMNDWRTHNGIDIAVNEGDEAVSIGKGKVSKVIVDSAFGYTVEVDYGSFIARYCGLRQDGCVGIGQNLEKGDSIGIVETVPCEADSVLHLHFEVLVDGMNSDPSVICEW